MIEDVQRDAEDRMKKAIEALRRDLQTIRTGRATPALLDRVTVEYYGTPTPLNQLATIAAPEPRLLTVKPWDKGVLSIIEKALQKSEMGFNPSNDGQLIRIPIPALTEERRREMVKMVKHKVEECRVAIRNVRRDVLHDLKEMESEKMISEDDHKRANEKIDTLSHKYVAEADQVGEAKEHEVLEV
ncbi:MAG: ribosome recycling factor [Chloroflexia bacterium]|jgi:ribosome recycling factor|nr:ribosome recycling factor [Chloroflexia bacterium]